MFKTRLNLRKVATIVACLAVMTTYWSCKDKDSDPTENPDPDEIGTWTKKENVPGGGRLAAVGFSIGNKGYIGIGDIGNGYVGKKDFWEYDQPSNTWTQKADFAGGDREYAVGFSIGDKGYIGIGIDHDGSMLNRTEFKDFWEYDPSSNTWTQKADFPGGVRFDAVGFSIGNKGYIGMGTDDGFFTEREQTDFWEYDPASNSWTKKADFPGGKRLGTVGFSIGNKGYIGTGIIWEKSDFSNDYKKDFWEYDPSTNVWTKKADFPGEERAYAVGFSVGNKGYVGTGSIESSYKGLKDIWEYNPASNSWTKKPDIQQGRASAVSFSIGNKGYVGTGIDGGNDFWEFVP